MFEFYNELHLGDNILHLYYLRKLADRDFKSTFYVEEQYISEMLVHIVGYENHIFIKPLSEKTPTAVNCWIGKDNIYYKNSNSWDYNNFYVWWFEFLSKEIGAPTVVDSMICDYAEIPKYIPEDSWDILYINSVGFSNGFGYNQEAYDAIAHILSQKYKILTTQKINGFECTRDYNWNLVQIGAASTKCKYVIANHTSPVHLCFNKWSIDNIEKWFIIHVRDSFTFNDKIERIENYQRFNDILHYFMSK